MLEALEWRAEEVEVGAAPPYSQAPAPMVMVSAAVTVEKGVG